MIFPSNRVRIMKATKPVDFRKGHDGLAALLKNELRKEPFTGTVFVFRAKRADRLKLLYWDGTGLVFAIGLERMATRWLTLQTAGRAKIYLARDPGWSDDAEPRPVRSAVLGVRLASYPGHRSTRARDGGVTAAG